MRRPLPRRALLPLPALLLGLAVTAPAGATYAPGATFLVNASPGSIAPLPNPVNDSALSGGQSISDDGRYVAFLSKADGLSSDDDDHVRNVLVKDRSTGAVELVSRADGPAGEPAHGSSDHPSISDDGTRVAFATYTTLDPADTDGGASDVYLRDTAAGTTTLVSKGNASAYAPQISGNGTTVVFETGATNLDPADTDPNTDVYRWQDGATTLVSRRSGAAGARGNFTSRYASVSDNGNLVAFESIANDLVAGDANGKQDIFVRNVAAATTVLVSAPDGTATPTANSASYEPAITGDGSGVAFMSRATNLVSTGDSTGDDDIYYRTFATATTTLVSRRPGAAKANGISQRPSVSDDGQTIAFRSTATNLDSADTSAGFSAYVWRAGAATGPELVSRGSGDAGPDAAGDVEFIQLGGAGAAGNQAVVFDLDRGGLTPDSGAEDGSAVFARTLGSPRTTSLVSRPAGDAPFVNGGGAAWLGGRGAVSGDGRYVVFIGRVAAVAPGHRQVFVRDTLTNEVRLASRADGAAGAAANGDSYAAAISADGQRVAFLTAATNLDPADTDAWQSVYVRDLASGRTWLASRADGADGATASSQVYELAMSADGRRVAFTTTAGNLGDGPSVGNGNALVHVRDLASGRTLLGSRADGNQGAIADANSLEPALSADGARVAFSTYATNLADGDADGTLDVHVRDLAGDRTILASARADGVKANGQSSSPALSDDGTRVAFLSYNDNLDPDVPIDDTSAFIRDLAGGVHVLVGITPDMTDNVHSVALSGDGHSAAVVSGAALAPGASGTSLQVFHVDVDTGKITLASRGNGATGQEWNGDIDRIAISRDGSCVAWDAIPATFTGIGPDFSAVFARAVGGECPRVAPETTIDAATALGGNRWRVTFSADQAGSTFACSVDGAGATPCTSPLDIGPLPSGVHTISVRATNAAGTPDSTPATTTVTAVDAGPGPGADTSAPQLDRLAVKPKRVRSGRKATVGFHLSEPATVRATVERLTAGRKQGGRCRSTAKRGARCTIARVVWRLPAVRAQAGAGRLTLPAKLKHRGLPPGAYRISVAATDAAGNRSAVRRAAFTIS